MAFKIHFGTDGWRGVIADDYTFENVRRCAQGFANYLLKHDKKNQWVVVGYDKRFHSEHFAQSVSEVLLANDLKVYLTQDATPTPVIAHAIVDKKAGGGVNITASHNPPTDNGFKVRSEFGGAIDPDGLFEIESLIPQELNQVKTVSAADAESQGRLVRFDPTSAYIEQIGNMVDLQALRDAGLKIVVDPMWGNGIGWFQRLIGGGKTEIIEIHNLRNPIFPEMKRPEPIPPNINVGLETTLNQKADVLVVLDGDADRLGLGDENGQFVNQLRVYGLLAYYLLEVRGERGPIVRTLSTTSMLDKLGTIYNVPVFETGVGFKYVAPKMIETNAMIGGEESGGYAFHGHVPERDGILSGLFILDLMVRLKRKPSQLIDLLFSKVGSHFYDRIDTPFSGNRQDREKRILNARPLQIGGLKVTGLNSMDGYKFSLEDGGWLLIRFSGTEPIMRVYCETTFGDKVQAILKDGLRIAGIE